MQPAVEEWRTQPIEALLDAVVALESRDEAAAFMRDLCTIGELQALSQRWQVARLLDHGISYTEIATITGASTATITRIAAWLHHGMGGYKLVLDRVPPLVRP